jgi:hypothetical protein
MAINLKRLTPKQLDDLTRELEAHKSERRSSNQEERFARPRQANRLMILP